MHSLTPFRRRMHSSTFKLLFFVCSCISRLDTVTSIELNLCIVLYFSISISILIIYKLSFPIFRSSLMVIKYAHMVSKDYLLEHFTRIIRCFVPEFFIRINLTNEIISVIYREHLNSKQHVLVTGLTYGCSRVSDPKEGINIL